MKTREEVLVEIKQVLETDCFVTECYLPVAFDEKANLWNDLDLDSLDRVAIVQALEREMHVNIPDLEIEKLNTVGDLVSIVYNLEKEKCEDKIMSP